MKKLSKIILLSAGGFILASSSALADLTTDEKKTFYFSIGLNMLKPAATNKDQFVAKKLPRNTTTTTTTYSSPDVVISYPKKNIIMPFVAIGYYVKDNLRLEAAFIRPFIKDAQINQRFEVKNDNNSADVLPVNREVLHSANINLGQLRVYFDGLPIKEYGSLYLAAGAGFGQIQTTRLAQVPNNAAPTNTTKETLTKYSPNWMLGCGANVNIAQGIKFGLGYEFQNFGKGKKPSDALFITYQSRSFKGSSATLRLIYDI